MSGQLDSAGFVIGQSDSVAASHSGQSDDACAAAQFEDWRADRPVRLQNGGDHGDGRWPDECPVRHAVILGGGGAGGGFIEQGIGIGGQQQLPGLAGGFEGSEDPAPGQRKRACGGGDVRGLFWLERDQFGTEVDGSGDHYCGVG